MAHGEYKTPGGKLVIADFEIVDDALSSVMITGDFFLEPPEALETINQALEARPVTLSQGDFTALISDALSDDVELVGFSPESIAIAVRRGIDGR